MAASRQSTDKAVAQWDRESLLHLLAFLNLHLDTFQRGQCVEDQDVPVVGPGLVAESLTKTFGKECSRSRVENKFSLLWRKGRPISKKDTDVIELYEHGVYPWTLPHLEDSSQDIFNDIAITVAGMRRKESGAILEKEHASSQRQNLRSKNHDLSLDWKIKCVCLWDTDDGHTVQCDTCEVWQHIYCTYVARGKDQPSKKTIHKCDDCKAHQANQSIKSGDRPSSPSPNLVKPASSEETIKELEQLVRELRLNERNLSRASQNHAEAFINQKEALRNSKFTRFYQDNPTHFKVASVEDSKLLRKWDSMIHNVSQIGNVIADGDTSIKIPSWTALQENTELLALFRAVLGDKLEKKMQQLSVHLRALSIRPEHLLCAIFSAAIQRWVFHSEFPSFVPQNSRLLEAYQKCLLETDGIDVLKNLHRAAWTRLTEENSKDFLEMSADLAKLFANRISSVFLTILITVTSKQPAQSINDLTGSTVQSQQVHKKLVDIFQAGLQLKSRLPLSDRFYEVYIPSWDTTFDPVTMDTKKLPDDMETRPSHAKVALCLSPALIEHSPDEKKAEKIDSLLGLNNFSKSNRLRKKGSGDVVSMANVSLQLNSGLI